MKKSSSVSDQKGGERPPDAAERDRARFDLDRNLVVEAGAGTGKTTLLTDRLLFLLLAGGPGRAGLPITRLVALTFTEKAAGEIKLRLASRLADLLAAAEGRPLPEGRRLEAEERLAQAGERFGRSPRQARAAAEAALQELDRAPIGTLHSFASTLLRLFPVEAGIDPGFAVDAKGSAFDDLFDAEWALWLDAEMAEGSPRAAAWLEVLPAAPLDDLRELARELCRERYAEAALSLDPDRRARFRGELRAFASLPDGKPAPRRGKLLEAHAAITAHLRDLEAVLDAPAPAPGRFRRREFSREAALQWPAEWAGHAALHPAYAAVARFAGRVSRDAELLVRRAAALIKPFVDRFRDEFRRRGNVGFDGLLLQARNLVRDNADVRRELKERFSAFLVDEFQDTDPLQGELVLYLSERTDDFRRDWREVRLSPGKIFVVGDSKQSIYRFRGADVRAYEAFTRRILAQDGAACALRTNFRSHDGLLAPVNAVFSEVMRAEEGLQPDYRPLIAAPASPRRDGAGCRWVLSAGPGEDVKADEAQAREARWVADWVRRHGAHDESPPPGKHRFGEIAVLLQTARPLSHFLEAFKEAGIPYAVEIDRAFYGAQEVIDLMNLLRALDDPRDAVSLTGLLRSPLATLEDADVYRLAEAGALRYDADPPASLAAPARARVAALYGLLRRFRARLGREPLGEFVAALFRESFFVELCAEAYHREQTVSNLHKFARLAAEADESRGETLKRFIARVAGLMDESAEEGESPLADDRLNAVRLLTIHKAKGLEYDVVFLPNLSGARSDRGRKEAGRVDWATGAAGLRLPGAGAANLAMAMMEREEREREKRELVRLLYVGMTRARRALYLLGRPDPPADSFAEILGRAGLWPAADQAEMDVAGTRSAVERIGPGGPRRAAREPDAPRPLPLAEMIRAWKRRWAERDDLPVEPVLDSPTRAARTTGKPRTIEPASPSGEGGALVGQVCHRVLEQWDFASRTPPDEHVGRACDELAADHPLADWKTVREESTAVLRAFLRSDAARALGGSEILGREVPFIFSKDGQAVRGAIDLIYRNEEGLWVADYKTDRLDGLDPVQRARSYHEQGRAYQEAVRKSLGETCGFRIVFLRTGQLVTAAPPDAK